MPFQGDFLGGMYNEKCFRIFYSSAGSTIFCALKMGCCFFHFGTLLNFEEGNSNFIENNFGATMKYQIIDGRSRNRLKFGDHDTPLWLLFNGEAKEFGPEKFVFEIKWKSMYLTNEEFCGINRPWYM